MLHRPEKTTDDSGHCINAPEVSSPVFSVDEGPGAIVAAAIHNGHEIRPEVARYLAIDEADRLREEDPLTALWTSVVPTRIRVHRSRFEVDMNRRRDRAVYRGPEDAWGLDVWREEPPRHLFESSLREYDRFYSAVGALLERKIEECGRVVVLDLHTYNHRRAGPQEPPAPDVANPEINLGTGTMDRDYWEPLVEHFLQDLRSSTIYGRSPDVRENVKFQGGHFPRWIHDRYRFQACVLSIEFKKIFMDEWRATADRNEVWAIARALESTVQGLLDEISKIQAATPSATAV